MLDAAQFGAEIGGIIREAVAKSTEPLLRRLKELEQQIAAMPSPVKGEPGGKGDDGLPGKDGRDGVDGQDGKDAVDGINGKDGEKGKDGTDGRDGIDGKDGVDGKPGDNGVDGKNGRDGVDGKSVTIADVESLIESRAAKWELDFERRAQERLLREIERMPKAKDGERGKDGIDGFGFDDLQFEHDGERVVKFVFVRGDQRKEFTATVPAMIYRGVYKAADQYEKGDAATFNGSLWIADEQTKSEPGLQASGWRLAVRKGRDGKDADAIERKSETGPVRLK